MMIRKKVGQAMVEYLMVLAVALLILVPTVYFFTAQSSNITIEASFTKLDSFGFSLTELIDSMYILGTDSKTTLEVNIPQGLKNISVINTTAGNYSPGYDLILDLDLQGVQSQLLYVSTYPFFIGNCSAGFKPFPESFFSNPGRKEFQVTSCGSAVAVWYR